jgi:hypothetical protein
MGSRLMAATLLHKARRGAAEAGGECGEVKQQGAVAAGHGLDAQGKKLFIKKNKDPACGLREFWRASVGEEDIGHDKRNDVQPQPPVPFEGRCSGKLPAILIEKVEGEGL